MIKKLKKSLLFIRSNNRRTNILNIFDNARYRDSRVSERNLFVVSLIKSFRYILSVSINALEQNQRRFDRDFFDVSMTEISSMPFLAKAFAAYAAQNFPK